MESAFKLTGGFGRFQIISLLAMSILNNSGNYLYYCFAYLVEE